MSAGDELTQLLDAVSEARAAKTKAKERAHLAYCATVARVVEYEVRARTDPAAPLPDENSDAGRRARRGAQARAARHLKMSRTNVGALLRDLALAQCRGGAAESTPSGKWVFAPQDVGTLYGNACRSIADGRATQVPDDVVGDLVRSGYCNGLRELSPAGRALADASRMLTAT